MTDHEDRPERSPTTAKDARSDAELDAIAEAEVEGLPVSTDAAFRTPRAKGRFAAAIDAVLPRGRFGDQRDILGGAGQNVIGLAAGVLTTFATQVIMTRGLGPALFGVVTLTTQFAFIASTATRFGMDVANVRLVAILIGRGESGRTRPLVRTSAIIAAVFSVAVARGRGPALGLALDRVRLPQVPPAGRRRVRRGGRRDPVRGAHVGLPGRHARSEDHAAHPVHLLDRPAARVDRDRRRGLVLRQDRRGDRVRVRGVLGDRVAGSRGGRGNARRGGSTRGPRAPASPRNARAR